jgi:hypothetical protein
MEPPEFMAAATDPVLHFFSLFITLSFSFFFFASYAIFY